VLVHLHHMRINEPINSAEKCMVKALARVLTQSAQGKAKVITWNKKVLDNDRAIAVAYWAICVGRLPVDCRIRCSQ